MVVRILRDGQGVPRHFLERGAASPAKAVQKGESRVNVGGAARPVKVLYIAGLGRSGSTILANTLGQIKGFFSGGELNFIWKHALIENRLCGCGRPSQECEFWGPVSDSRVVVDTSKEPAYGYALGMVPAVDLRVLHLIRDPRAAAYSWAKKKRQPDSDEREFMHQKTPMQSAVLWDAWNA